MTTTGRRQQWHCIIWGWIMVFLIIIKTIRLIEKLKRTWLTILRNTGCVIMPKVGRLSVIFSYSVPFSQRLQGSFKDWLQGSFKDWLQGSHITNYISQFDQVVCLSYQFRFTIILFMHMSYCGRINPWEAYRLNKITGPRLKWAQNWWQIILRLILRLNNV